MADNQNWNVLMHAGGIEFMARRLLLTWELGSGLGHLMNLRPFVVGLASRGHQVFLAARDLSQIRQVFGEGKITPLQAPWASRRTRIIEPITTYADLLLSAGFGDENSLEAHVEAWHSLFALVDPELMICDHAPSALLAAKDGAFPVATVGSGFMPDRRVAAASAPPGIARTSSAGDSSRRAVAPHDQPSIGHPILAETPASDATLPRRCDSPLFNDLPRIGPFSRSS